MGPSIWGGPWEAPWGRSSAVVPAVGSHCQGPPGKDLLPGRGQPAKWYNYWVQMAKHSFLGTSAARSSYCCHCHHERWCGGLAHLSVSFMFFFCIQYGVSSVAHRHGAIWDVSTCCRQVSCGSCIFPEKHTWMSWVPMGILHGKCAYV